jgi:hypothetical protein
MFRWVASFHAVFFGVVLAAASATAQTAPNPPILCLDENCLPSTSPPSTASMKWNPGWYIRIQPDLFPTTNSNSRNPATLEQIFQFMDSIKNEPNIKGVLVAGVWSQWEGRTPGDYSAGFATMDALLAKAKANGQRVIWDPFLHVFGDYGSDWTRIFPAYLVQTTFSGTDTGGKYGITPMWGSPEKGLQPRLWQAATMDRVIALFKAYGARYDSHPNLEMVSGGETSINVSVGTDGYNFTNIDAQFKRFLAEVRPAYRQTQLRLNANWYFGEASMISLINYAANLNYVFGGPDTVPKDVGEANQAFTGALPGSTDWRGKVAFVSEVQDPELGGKAGTYTNRQLYRAAMYGESTSSGSSVDNNLGSNRFRAVQPQYWVWYYNTWSGGPEQKWSTGTLPFIRSLSRDMSVEMRTVYSVTCPTAYKVGCKSN